ncbi:PDDEXK nuclease domain-containing protein [bacterium]|nr:PDDEXK nuclease domain-containing protein [bacterium]
MKSSARKKPAKCASAESATAYVQIVEDISELLESARRGAARAVNTILTATYWEIGRRIIEFEQSGRTRAEYGVELLNRLSADLSARFGRGFSVDNLELMRLFYIHYPFHDISETGSRESGNSETGSRKFDLQQLATTLKLSWSHYVLLVRRARSNEARAFYETEALRGGWSVRQLERQIDSQFYERMASSRPKAAMPARTNISDVSKEPAYESEFRDPFVLEFLDLKDEYSENDLEQALIRHLETFLLELGRDFTFVSRQKRMRVGDEWYRVDPVFYHRGLRCLVLIDLKLGRLTHADAGQMDMYLNYACEHWTRPDENPPVGLILCTHKDNAVAHYALDGLRNKVLAAEYKIALPDEKKIAQELMHTRKMLETRSVLKNPKRKGSRPPDRTSKSR